MTKDWLKGDSVVHASRPEWGAGEVLGVEPFRQDGKAFQRLTIKFSRVGTKTISTAFAELRSAADMPRMPASSVIPEGEAEADPIAQLADRASVEQLMTTLPDRATDPFSGLKSRLAATLELYRFDGGGGSLLDWAAVQTGLKDPLSRFNRHELEGWFARFKIELDTHLRKLVRDVRKHEPAALEQAATAAGPAARQALRRADSLR